MWLDLSLILSRLSCWCKNFCYMLTSCLEQLPSKTDLRLWPFVMEARGSRMESPVNYTCLGLNAVCGSLK